MRNHDYRKPSQSARSFVQICDAEGLKAIGCPWSPNALYCMRRRGENPKLFTKLTSHKVFLVVEEFERMMREGIGK